MLALLIIYIIGAISSIVVGIETGIFKDVKEYGEISASFTLLCLAMCLNTAIAYLAVFSMCVDR